MIVDRNGNVRFDMNKEGPGTATDSPGRPGSNRPGNAQGQGQTGPQGPPGRASGYTSAPGRERGSLPDLRETNHKGRTGLFRPKYGREACRTCQKHCKRRWLTAEPHNQRINHYQRIAVGGERGRRAPFLATGGQGGRLRPVLRKSANPGVHVLPLDPPKEQKIRAWLSELVAAGMVGTPRPAGAGTINTLMFLATWHQPTHDVAKQVTPPFSLI